MDAPARPAKPVVNLADLELDRWTQGERYASADASFGRRIGLAKLGISYGEVPPGKSGCPFHNHRQEEELFVILEGEGTYRYGGEEHPVRAGDVLGAPAGGPETAHQIVNTGSGPLRYLGVSANVEAEVVEYPDSGKFLAVSRLPDGSRFRFVGRREGEADYWDGEPGA
ncbi:cupin domain-containing protein [Aureimonas leprariae]|uniref:Cupin domain-containing protein n=1 Tax=Plantimonas leprariae TaxID=2615207 RepID=A0A7V7PMG1_9HYPH|nr:cupin domain-containing protein [Aureimonas leprariae]KAB0678109.1 cupin domain-containing protein [Aureimonas leprariae]